MISIKKESLLEDGKAKTIYQTNDPDVIWVHSKDQATALNGKRKVQIQHKGFYTNQISSLLFQYLTTQNIANHFITQESETDMLSKKLTMIPLEVVVRGFASGHFVTRFNVPEKQPLVPKVVEFYYKSDELDDPMINDLQIQALGLLTKNQIELVKNRALKINNILTMLFDQLAIDLIDIKFEFGYAKDDEIILGDELSPDNMRLIDRTTNQSLDKDVFRQSLGNLNDGYAIVLNRLKQKLGV